MSGETKSNKQFSKQSTKQSKTVSGWKKRQITVAPYVFAAFTGDRSGSMQGIYRESATGLYEWATDLIESANENNQQGRMFITCFDNKADKRLDNVDFKNVQITQEKCMGWMKPRGSTRLYDTAIEDLDNIIEKVEEFKNNLPRAVKMLNPDVSIVWACCTDGYDNSSVNTGEDLKKKVLWAREKGVKCFFLAANQDAVTTGQSYGFSADTSMTYTADAEHSAMAFRSVSTNMKQASRGESFTFTHCQRQSSLQSNQSQPNTPPSAPSTGPSTAPTAPSKAQRANLFDSPPTSPRQFSSPPPLTNRQRFYMNYMNRNQTPPLLTRSPGVRFW